MAGIPHLIAGSAGFDDSRTTDAILIPASNCASKCFSWSCPVGSAIIGGGIVDFLEDKKTGLFCKIKDPEDLAEKMKLLLTDEKLYQAIKENGLKLVEEKYGWHLIAVEMDKIFLKLITT